MSTTFTFRKILAGILCAVLAVWCVPTIVAFSQESDEALSVSSSVQDAVFEKSEVIYANLSADGIPESVYVVNYFDISEGGLVKDYGSYSDVKLLVNESELTLEGDEVSFEAEAGDFYYQGYAESTVLPWDITITYELDGQEISAEELAGASGSLVVRIEVVQNESVNSIFYESFMIQATITLKDEVSSAIQAEEATVARSADTTVLTFVSLPGNDGVFVVEAEVQDFSMDAIQVSALPYSLAIEMPETDGIIEEMSQLSEAITELSEGVSELASGTSDLSEGSDDLNAGSQEFYEGLLQLSASSSDLLEASSGVSLALSEISGGLSTLDLSSFEQLEALPDVLNQLADSLDELSVASGVTQQACEEALSSIATFTITDEALAQLLLTVSGTDDEATVVNLIASYQTLQGVKEVLAAANTLLDTSASALGVQAQVLRDLATQLEGALGSGQLDQLSLLSDGLLSLSEQYTLVHSGLEQYTQGLDSLAEGYADLDLGVEEVAEGVAQLQDGIDVLESAMIELNDSTITLPESVQAEIDALTEGFEFTEFDSSSYMSEFNENVSTVQFVFYVEAIEQPEVEEVEQPEEELTIWDRFLALFSFL